MPQSQIPLIKGDKTGSETDYRDGLPINMYAVQKNILGAAGYMQNYSGVKYFYKPILIQDSPPNNTPTEGRTTDIGDAIWYKKALSNILAVPIPNTPKYQECKVIFPSESIVDDGVYIYFGVENSDLCSVLLFRGSSVFQYSVISNSVLIAGSVIFTPPASPIVVTLNRRTNILNIVGVNSYDLSGNMPSGSDIGFETFKNALPERIVNFISSQ